LALDRDSFESGNDLPRIVAVSLQQTGHLFNYLAGNAELRRGDRVLVDSDGGVRVGTVELEPHEPAHTLDLSQLKSIIRLVGPDDLRVEADNLDREARARRLCLERIHERAMAMKLVNVDYAFDGRKAVFYFIAENRIDFRDLVRDLANTLRVRVEMKQIGARDETKLVGALGPCGRELCCSSWLREFHAISVKMAKEQDLSLNPSKLAGMCGRLKCCLRYEYETYLELKRALPPVGRRVTSVKGDGVVVRQLPMRESVLVRRDEDGAEVEATLEDLVEKKAE